MSCTHYHLKKKKSYLGWIHGYGTVLCAQLPPQLDLDKFLFTITSISFFPNFIHLLACLVMFCSESNIKWYTEMQANIYSTTFVDQFLCFIQRRFCKVCFFISWNEPTRLPKFDQYWKRQKIWKALRELPTVISFHFHLRS